MIRRTAHITPDIARQVLWYYGDRKLGFEPGGFTHKLIGAAAHADSFNISKLALAFPEIAEAVNLAKNFPEGMDQLREIAQR